MTVMHVVTTNVDMVVALRLATCITDLLWNGNNGNIYDDGDGGGADGRYDGDGDQALVAMMVMLVRCGGCRFGADDASLAGLVSAMLVRCP